MNCYDGGLICFFHCFFKNITIDLFLSTRNLDEVFLENLEGEKKSSGSIAESQKQPKEHLQKVWMV